MQRLAAKPKGELGDDLQRQASWRLKKWHRVDNPEQTRWGEGKRERERERSP